MAKVAVRELEEGLPLWEQQPGENDREYQLFLLYAQAGPGRSVRGVVAAWNAVRADSVTEWHVSNLMRRWRWVQRAGSYVQTTGALLSSLRNEMVVQLTAELFAESTRVRKMILDLIDAAKLDEMEPEQIRKQLASLMQMYRQIAELTISMLTTLRQFVADAPAEPAGVDLVETMLKKAYDERLALAATAQPQLAGEDTPMGRLVTVNGVVVLISGK